MAGSDLASWCCVISWCRVVLAVYIRRPREARRKDECAVVEDRRVREKEKAAATAVFRVWDLVVIFVRMLVRCIL